MQISLSDEVPSAGDVDRNGVEFEAEPDTSKPDGVSNDIDKIHHHFICRRKHKQKIILLIFFFYPREF